jgi:hypothetical protein
MILNGRGHIPRNNLACIVEKRGSWLAFGGEQLAQGSLSAIAFLKDHPEITGKIAEMVKTAPLDPIRAKTPKKAA